MLLSDGFSYPEFRFSDISQDSKAERHVIKFLCKSSMCTRKETFPVLVFQTGMKRLKCDGSITVRKSFDCVLSEWQRFYVGLIINDTNRWVSHSVSHMEKLNSLKFPRAEPSEEKHCGKIFCIWNIFHFIFCEKKKYLHVWNNYFFLYNIFFNALIFFFFNKLTKQKIPPCVHRFKNQFLSLLFWWIIVIKNFFYLISHMEENIVPKLT